MNNIVTIAAADIYAAHDLAMITPIASDTALTERALTNVFCFTNRDDQTGAAIARYLYDVMGKRRAVLIETETMYGHSMACAFSRASGPVFSGACHRHQFARRRDNNCPRMTKQLSPSIVSIQS
ncbi:hypothetical protein NKJ90_04730 [Mesorhizobium sp. M0051]|uniref:hypothetical protein n=1 Tax=unclassified Mesorhizobium TaxID=325217 RepID=UPI0003CF8EE1|nr:hypothetical protein [Mesorhizobium sp. LNHC252B00]ESY72276.1 hypothetical protein X743_16920 [Mesorhizobium sp. LNHC252B00]